MQWIVNKGYVWTDSFISRRIERILLYSEPESWSYFPTNGNYADVASRSMPLRNFTHGNCGLVDPSS